ncbi:MAG: TadE/TadG family type IV pilus assembly protein [Actinomycetota bacterium]
MRDEGSRRRCERGSSAVEFALVLPILVLVLAALVRVGLIARDALLVQQAARAAAREAAVTDDPARIESALTNAATGLDAARMTFTVERDGTRGDAVAVSVTYADLVAVGVPWLPDVVMLTASAVMRQEFG